MSGELIAHPIVLVFMAKKGTKTTVAVITLSEMTLSHAAGINVQVVHLRKIVLVAFLVLDGKTTPTWATIRLLLRMVCLSFCDCFVVNMYCTTIILLLNTFSFLSFN